MIKCVLIIRMIRIIEPARVQVEKIAEMGKMAKQEFQKGNLRIVLMVKTNMEVKVKLVGLKILFPNHQVHILAT